jgi:ssDNA-binding Zn-finger/Zn-ribbon topoisomerase 1
MNLKRLLDNPWLIRITLIISIASCSVAALLLTKVDNIVNATLYQFGLGFSYDWANPYWLNMRLAFALLEASIALTFFTLVIAFSKSMNQLQHKGKIQHLLALDESAKAFVLEKDDDDEAPMPTEEKIDAAVPLQETVKLHEFKGNAEAKENGTQGIACPNCEKISSRPLVMLDFAEGKTKLVNVCPYCNFTLGDIENQEKPDDNIHVESAEKQRPKARNRSHS